MINRKLLVAFMSTVITIGCTNRKVLTKNYSLNEVEEKIEILHTSPNQSLNKIDVSKLNQMKLIDKKYLVLVDKASENKGILILDRKNFSLLGKTGIKGEGPQEISNYSELIPFKGGFLMADYAKKILYFYDIKKAIEDTNYLPETYGPLKTFLSSLRITKGNQYIGTQLGMSQSVEGALEINIVKGDISKEESDLVIPHYKEVDATQTSMDPSNLLCYIEKDQDLFSVSYTPYDLFTIYNVNGELVRSIKGEEKLKKREGYSYFRHTQFTPNYIYVDHQNNAIYKKNNKGKMQYAGYNTILCFDREGTYQETLESEHPFDLFLILPDKKEIIFYRANSDTPFTSTRLSI
ncbi:hypothetical protein OAT16_02265 [Prolixibacteraceae bacterium]|nr:hypothetical protein [Prolixibacteraceae bacterium]